MLIQIVIILKLYISIKSYEYNEYNEYKPIIGIYGIPNPENEKEKINETYYPGSIIRFLDSFGAEIIAIHYWYDDKLIDELLKEINLILFIGTNRTLNITDIWEQKALNIINKGKKNNVPIYGISQGFQLIISLISDTNEILKNDYDDFNIYHNLFNLNNQSQIFYLFDNKTFDILLNKNSTLYFHNNGFSKEDFENNKNLKEFQISSLSKDKKGKIFVNSFESLNSNQTIFGTQFNNDIIIYDRCINSTINYHNDAIRISNLFNSFIVNLARNNNNKMEIEKRNNYDFFDLYSNKTNYFKYDLDKDLFYFKKPKIKVEYHLIPLIFIICFESIIIFTIINAFYHFWYKYDDDNEPIEKEENEKLIP